MRLAITPVRHLQDLKGRTVLTETMPFTISEAAAAEEAGIDTLKVRFDPRNPASAHRHPQGCSETFMTFCIGLTKVATIDEAVRAGFDAMEAGADGVMCQWGPDFIRAVSRVGIPVQAHTGLVPRLSTWTGGLRAVGKTLEEAVRIFRQIRSFEEAGAWAVEVEVIPAELLKELLQPYSPCDILDWRRQWRRHSVSVRRRHPRQSRPPFPRHTKQYRNLFQMEQTLQTERVEGFKDFIKDVRSGGFPGPEHTVKAPEGLIAQFLEAIE
ncbi:MAG UNVERIFIED_CONTAM: 3-methyl-2-oxobutanoate hydroxymethyltransferase [Planctomycetaceae bacterium]|jgi:3-methyl-2-oxobutanoate hydroxymethyltransferase